MENACGHSPEVSVLQPDWTKGVHLSVIAHLSIWLGKNPPLDGYDFICTGVS
jgi:hypothetical protein